MHALASRLPSLACALIISATLCAQVPTENCAVAVHTPGQGLVLCPSNTHTDDTHVLDLPGSFVVGATSYRSLCGGDRIEYTLGVTVIDGPGPDLQIEEVNPNSTETYRVEVSPDGVNWFNLVGPYANGLHAGDSAIDISPLGSGILVQYVAIIDASLTTAGTTPGPDFDAIIAINYQAPLFGGVARPYADTLINYNPGASTSNQFTDGTQALGMPNSYRNEVYTGPAITTFAGYFYNFVCLPTGSSVTVLFSRDWIVDGPGADVLVHEYYSVEPQFNVEASDDGVNFHPLPFVGNVSPAHGNGHAVSANIRAFDLAGSGLARADYIRVVSTSTSTTGATPGPDLDAIEAVNSIGKELWLYPGAPFVQGNVGSVMMTAVAHGGEPYVTVGALTPPWPTGAGLPLPGGSEVRLDIFNDPLIQFELNDPAAPIFFSGVTGLLPPATATAATSLALPPAPPALSGTVIFWQSVVIAPGGTFPASGILRSAIP